MDRKLVTTTLMALALGCSLPHPGPILHEGMTKEQVKNNFGDPHTTTKDKNIESWIYTEKQQQSYLDIEVNVPTKILIFKDNVLRSWISSH